MPSSLIRSDILVSDILLFTVAKHAGKITSYCTKLLLTVQMYCLLLKSILTHTFCPFIVFLSSYNTGQEFGPPLEGTFLLI